MPRGRAPLWLNARCKTVPPVRDEAPDIAAAAAGCAGCAAPKAARPRAADESRSRRRRERMRWALFALLPLALDRRRVIGTSPAARSCRPTMPMCKPRRSASRPTFPASSRTLRCSDNQHVAAGQVLYRLDPRQFQIALDNAKANLAQTALTIDAMKQDYKRMLSDVAAQQAQVDLDQTNFDRNAMLLRSGTVSQAMYDQARYTLRQRQEQARSRCASRRRCSSPSSAAMPTLPSTQHPQYLQAQAQVDEAQRQLDHTVVTAPFAGIVTNVPRDRARQVSRGLDDRILSGRYRSRLGRRQLRRRPS